jgi:hypothetical protein
MTPLKTEKPLWAWFVLIGGGLFLLTSLPGFVLISFIPLWKTGELSFWTIMYMMIPLCVLTGTIWGIARAVNTLRTFKLEQSRAAIIDAGSAEAVKPIWPWLVIAPGALLLIKMGPGVVMLPIMPLFLAGMSTDSGTTPSYVPLLIVVIGYGLMSGYIFLLVRAIKRLSRKP